MGCEKCGGDDTQYCENCKDEYFKSHQKIEKQLRKFNEVHTDMLKVHARSLACHCECLGLNAENCASACVGTTIPYNRSHYYQVMQKWGFIDERGEPTI